VVSSLLIASPALALLSSQAYARVVQQAEWIAYQAATKPQIAQAIGQAAAAATPASLAFRAVTGPLGWAALGISAGLALLQWYYSAQDLQTIKQNASTPTGQLVYSYNGLSYIIPQPGEQIFDVNPADCPSGKVLFSSSGSAPYPGLLPFKFISGYWCIPAFTPQTIPATPQQITDYVNSLPPTDPQSVEQHTQTVGAGNQPQTAVNVTTKPTAPEEVPTTVKKQEDVLPTDVVVAPTVPPPAGSTATTTKTQTSSTTTTTQTNPDGSTTQSQQDSTGVSCTVGGTHDQRTFGTVLQDHQTKWTTAPLLSALNQLKTLTWPSTLPVVTFASVMLGSFQVDFNQWAWVFLALKTLILAGASLAAYRIVFVGGR
jgi:hypothetical protein